MTSEIICLLVLSIICCFHAYLPTPFSPPFYRHHKHQYSKKDVESITNSVRRSAPFYRYHKHQYSKKDDVESITNSVRRDVVGGIGLFSQIALLLTTSAASVSYAKNTVVGKKPMIDETATMPKDWNKRLRSGNAQMLPRGVLQAPDVYYPSYMAGLWNTSSSGIGFTAPLGEKLFGGASAVRAAERDMNNTLIYPSQFSPLPDDSGRVIADRLFNVKSIAVASMGEGAIFDESQPDSNPARRLHLGIAPSKNVGAQDVGNLFDIDLIAVSRQFRPSADNKDVFEVLETTCQLITKRSDLLVKGGVA